MIFMAAQGVCCCTWPFCSCGGWGLLSSCGAWFLIVAASLVAEHGL